MKPEHTYRVVDRTPDGPIFPEIPSLSRLRIGGAYNTQDITKRNPYLGVKMRRLGTQEVKKNLMTIFCFLLSTVRDRAALSPAGLN